MAVTTHQRVRACRHGHIYKYLIVRITTTWRVVLLRGFDELRIRDVTTEKLLPVVRIQSKFGTGENSDQLLQCIPTDNRNE